MNKKTGLIERILSGHKTIESRWYKTRRDPWNKAKIGETIFFKYSGKLIRAKAVIKNVMQFDNLDDEKIEVIVKEYGRSIDLVDWNYKQWGKGKKYCMLIEIEKPEKIPEFEIDKKGFGIGCAWLCYNEKSP